VRDPAVCQGIFGVRSTHNGTREKDASIPCPYGIISWTLSNFANSTRLFQCGGFFARSTQSMLGFGKFWFANSLSSEVGPISLFLIWFADFIEFEYYTIAVPQRLG